MLTKGIIFARLLDDFRSLIERESERVGYSPEGAADFAELRSDIYRKLYEEASE